MGKNLAGKELGEFLSQRKDGVYCARFTDRFGKRKSLYNKNLRELKVDLNNALYEDKNKMNIVDDKTTLDQWYVTWLDVHKHNIIRENTKRTYKHIYCRHISPELGKYKLTDITQVMVRKLIKNLEKKGLQFETQNKVRIILQDIFDKALIDEFVNRNPVRGIKLVRNEEVDRRVLIVEEQAEFFECCKGTFYDNLFTVAVATGLRMGELAALRLEDIDFDNRSINITRTLLYQKLEGDDGKTFHFLPPKTKSSVRKIPINRQCELALKKQILQKNIVIAKTPKKEDEEFKDLLFTTKYGNPLNCQNFTDGIRRVIDEINLRKDALEEMEYFSSHTFRHTFATRCIEAGIESKTVQYYLGHATLQMTMDLYTHVLEQHKNDEMNKLENVLDQVLDVSETSVEEQYNKMMQNASNGVVQMANVIMLKSS